MENITLDMLAEFEFDAETTAKFNAWAAFESMQQLGTSEEDIQLIYGVTLAELEPYRAGWETLKNK